MGINDKADYLDGVKDVLIPSYSLLFFPVIMV